MVSMSAKRRLLTALALLGLVGMVQACNTVEGAGKDVKKAGQGIEDSAERNK
jgi:predicted small secreted protein